MNRTLLSLAIIRTNWNIFRHDYIENFVPLFASLIKRQQYAEISLEQIDNIRTDFKNEYGLDIPSNPILTILNRLSKKKYIIRDHNKFIPNQDKLAEVDLSPESNKITREFELVTTSLKSFIQVKHDLTLSDSDIENGLISYLKKHDLDLLFAAEKNSMLPNIRTNQKLQYLINDFIGDAFRSNPELFQFILDLTIGHALSATILYDDFASYQSNFKGLSLFLDTPLIFNLLGLHGDLKKSLAEELVSILNDEGVNLFVLEITQTEVTANLEEAHRLLEKGKSDPTKGNMTFKDCIDNGLNENDVEQIIITLPDFYKKYKIKNSEIPNYDEFREHQIDEEKLYQTIVNTYDGVVPSVKPKEEKGARIQDNKKEEPIAEKEKTEKINNTIYRDVQVLSGVYRYRLGNKPKTLKDCKFLFITTNSSLAYASRKFEKWENNNRVSLPTCLTDIFLGTLIWLHSPTKMEIINEKKIIAESYAALKPNMRLIAKYLEDVEKLKKNGSISEEHYLLLRTHRSALNILENKTFGDISEFTSQTTEEILEELIDSLKSEEKQKYIQEKEKHEKTQEKLDSLQNQLDKIYNYSRHREHERVHAKIARKKRLFKKAEQKAVNWIKTINTFLGILLFTSISVLAINEIENDFVSKWVLYATTGIVGVFNFISWFDINKFKKKIRLKIYSFYKNKYLTRLEEFSIE